MLILRSIVLAGLLMFFTCRAEEPPVERYCGCGGIMENEVVEMPGLLVYISSYDSWYIDIVNKNGEKFAFLICDVVDIGDQNKIDSLEVVFSGIYNKPRTEKRRNSALLNVTSLKSLN